MVELFFAKLDKRAVIPQKREEDAGYDIYGIFDEDMFIIPPHTTKMIGTGIASACDSGYYFQVEERGSTGSKGIKKSAGVIDSGYRGEWFIPITNTNNESLIFYNDSKFSEESMENSALSYFGLLYPQSKAIAQMVVLPVPRTEIREISREDLLKIKSERGTGALGSTGK